MAVRGLYGPAFRVLAAGLRMTGVQGLGFRASG